MLSEKNYVSLKPKNETGKMRIINKAGVDLSLLIRSLKHHEDNSKCVVLKVHIFEDRSFILVDYNYFLPRK